MISITLIREFKQHGSFTGETQKRREEEEEEDGDG